VKLRGVATAGTHFGNEGPGYLQDSTGGVAIFSFSGEFSKAVGTVVGPGNAFEMEVLGGVSLFNGNMEITPYSVRRVGVKPAITPQLTTTAHIAANGEGLEGLLVRIVGASIVSGSFPPAGASGDLVINDGSGPCNLRIDSDTDIDGQPTPAGKIDIIGIVNQFDFALPYTDGYQLLPRRIADISPTTAVSADKNEMPRQFQLSQNYPNPFFSAGATEIHFTLPSAAEVRLEIFNLLGERVALLGNGKIAAGEHQVRWDGGAENGKTVAGGIYFYRVLAETKNSKWIAIKKMVLLP
jgi:hypothetical protein